MPPRPPGYHTVTPRLFVDDVAAFLAFLQATFRASGATPSGAPAEVRIGDSLLLVSTTDARDAMPACLYVYVDDVVATWERALDEGAEAIEAPHETPYGDRRGIVEDAWGNVWQIATRTET